MQNRREMRKKKKKNALRRIFASGPCKYTRQAKTAPSTHARIISRHVSATHLQRCACRFELTLIALPVIARLEDDRQCLDGYCHILTTELTTLLIELNLGLFALGTLANAIHGALADILVSAVVQAAECVNLAGTPNSTASTASRNAWRNRR